MNTHTHKIKQVEYMHIKRSYMNFSARPPTSYRSAFCPPPAREQRPQAQRQALVASGGGGGQKEGQVCVCIAAHTTEPVLSLGRESRSFGHASCCSFWTTAANKKKFLLHSNRQLAEIRHVMCVVEKAGFEPRTLGTGVERATNCGEHVKPSPVRADSVTWTAASRPG